MFRSIFSSFTRLRIKIKIIKNQIENQKGKNLTNIQFYLLFIETFLEILFVITTRNFLFYLNVSVKTKDQQILQKEYNILVQICFYQDLLLSTFLLGKFLPRFTTFLSLFFFFFRLRKYHNKKKIELNQSYLYRVYINSLFMKNYCFIRLHCLIYTLLK